MMRYHFNVSNKWNMIHNNSYYFHFITTAWHHGKRWFIWSKNKSSVAVVFFDTLQDLLITFLFALVYVTNFSNLELAKKKKKRTVENKNENHCLERRRESRCHVTQDNTMGFIANEYKLNHYTLNHFRWQQIAL